MAYLTPFCSRNLIRLGWILFQEVISSWHPLDDDSPFVRNIFSAAERSSESARLDHQILNMMINRDSKQTNFDLIYNDLPLLA